MTFDTRKNTQIYLEQNKANSRVSSSYSDGRYSYPSHNDNQGHSEGGGEFGAIASPPPRGPKMKRKSTEKTPILCIKKISPSLGGDPGTLVSFMNK